MTSSNHRNGPVKRVNDDDFIRAENILINAMHVIVPDDRSQRKVFEALMPYLYVLRNKGCSWAQLTRMLAECKIKLQPSTVSSYYSEMLASRLDVCQEQMNEQILLMAEVRKETNKVALEATAKRVAAVLAARNDSVSAVVDDFFGVNKKSPTPVTNNATALPEPEAKAENKKPAQSADQDDDSFGLLNIAPSNKAQSGSTGFLNLDNNDTLAPPDTAEASKAVEVVEAPKTPKQRKTMPGDFSPAAENTTQLTAQVTAQAVFAAPTAAVPSPVVPEVKNKFICLPLEPGVESWDKREGVPPEVYMPGDMEHPFIEGLMLSMKARIYKPALEYENVVTGVRHLESTEARAFRIKWRKPMKLAPSSTSGDFMKLDPTLFNKQ